MQYKLGNLLDITSGIIAHGCNAQGVMGSGVALAVKNNYPECFAQYVHDIQINSFWVGENSIYHHSEELTIVNCITQMYYGRDGSKYVSYDAVDQCMRRLFKLANELEKDVHLPKIGAGFGGGNWNIIKTIIEENARYLKYDTNRITIWELK